MAAENQGPVDAAQARNALVVVAHPDDETLWAGGLILSHPHWYFSIACLCRGSDRDRVPKFHRACSALSATSCRIADLDDGPDQLPLPVELVEETILSLYPAEHWDYVMTHSFDGEYTRHLRHEEAARAVAGLWTRGKLCADELWMFAYEDAGRTKMPEAIADADLVLPLSEERFQRKYAIVTEIYGFDAESWEGRATPRTEAYWRFTDPHQLAGRFADASSEGSAGGDRHEDPHSL